MPLPSRRLNVALCLIGAVLVIVGGFASFTWISGDEESSGGKIPIVKVAVSDPDVAVDIEAAYFYHGGMSAAVTGHHKTSSLADQPFELYVFIDGGSGIVEWSAPEDGIDCLDYETMRDDEPVITDNCHEASGKYVVLRTGDGGFGFEVAFDGWSPRSRIDASSAVVYQLPTVTTYYEGDGEAYLSLDGDSYDYHVYSIAGAVRYDPDLHITASFFSVAGDEVPEGLVLDSALPEAQRKRIYDITWEEDDYISPYVRFADTTLARRQQSSSVFGGVLIGLGGGLLVEGAIRLVEGRLQSGKKEPRS